MNEEKVSTEHAEPAQYSRPADDWVGLTVQEKYEILSLIGRGGMGAVYAAKHVQLQVVRALKALTIESCSDRDSARQALQRFLREARTISSLSHPNIVACHDIGEGPGGTPYVVMDLLQGRTIAELIQSGDTLETSRILEIMIQVCKGLEHAHSKGVLHRDVKPSNIMLVEGEDGKPGVKILDFGIAKLTGAEESRAQRLTKTGEIIGSRYYISPEQVQGFKIDERSDVYSFGCTFYELLKGKVPFAGDTTVDTIVQLLSQEPPALTMRSGSKVPAPLERLVMRCLEKNPADRYQNVSLLRLDLERTVSGDPIAEVPLTGRLRKAVFRLQKSVPGLSLGVTAFVLLALVFLLLKTFPGFMMAGSEARVHLARADAYRSALKYGEAIAEATKAIELLPDLAHAYEIRADCYGGLRQWRQEIEDCTRAIQLNPRPANSYYFRAFAYSNLGKRQEAIEDAGRAIALGSSFPKLAYQVRAEGYKETGRYAKAIEDCTKVIELDPGDALAYLTRCVAYYKSSEYEKADADARKAIELDGRQADAHHYRALCAYCSGDWQKAIDEDTKAVQLNPAFTGAYFDRAGSLFEMQEFQKCIDDCTKAIGLEPGLARAYCRRAQGYLGLQRFAEAIADATKAIALDPNRQEAYECRSQAYMRLGMKTEAGRDADMIVKLLKPRL